MKKLIALMIGIGAIFFIVYLALMVNFFNIITSI